MNDQQHLSMLEQSFRKYLDRLKEQLLEYSKEETIWEIHGQITNSAGNLAVHLYGNLNHFIGTVLGDTGYVRDRPLEFSMPFQPRAEMIEEIEACKKMISAVLPNISPEVLHGDYPLKFGDQQPSTHHWLIHLMAHFSYHLGQINYHRRLLDLE